MIIPVFLMTQGPTSSAILASTIGGKSLGLTCAKDPLNKSKDSVNVLQSSPFELVGLTTRNNLSGFSGQGSQRRSYMDVACILLRLVLTQQTGQLRRR